MATKELVTGGTAMRARLSKAARWAFPGPWGVRPVLGESLGALCVAGFAVLFALVGHQGTVRTVLSAATVLLLFALRRGPAVPVLLVTAAGVGAIDSFSPLVVFAAWSAGYRVARVLPVAAVMGGAFLLMMTTALWHGDETVPVKGVMGVTLAGFLLFAVLPALAGRYLAQRRALVAALHERNEQLVREQAMIAHQARLRERHRIAQDMHDSLGHRLALISVHSGALEVDRTLTGAQREAVGVLRQASVAAMRELREVVGVLHEEAPAAAGATGAGGAGAAVPGRPGGGGLDGIDGLAEGSRLAGAVVALSRSGDSRPLPAAAGQAAYRVVQEALTNAHKHAPGAPITLALRYEPDALVVEVANGPAPEREGGLPAVSGGQGLTGLRERARLVGGMVHAGPTPDGGWRTAAVLPYQHVPHQGLPPDDAPVLAAEGAPPRGAGLPRRRRSPALGCAAGAVAVVLAVLGLIVWGVLSFVGELDRATVDRVAFDAVEVGSAEADVRSKLPAGSRFLTDDYRGTGPALPVGASCLWFVSDNPGGDDGFEAEYVARFCFRDGTLIDKQHYRAKV
ncbi:sensor histidine kinase [Kitasatospora sp. NPDC057223]|uniref:sensor histidine kinase n=1 Tax=Kitasatospora sp. NPDC057223 TaxID=3346055 RepID=UPI003641C607